MVMPFQVAGFDRRRSGQRDALMSEARRIREGASSLLGMQSEIEAEQRRLDQQQADLAVREHALRRRETALAEREQHNNRREDRITEHDRATAADDAGQRAALLEQHADRQRAATVAAIVQAGKRRRCEIVEPINVPKGSLAEKILIAAAKRRGEIA
jgi:uncharacterized protein (DUF3084 family)